MPMPMIRADGALFRRRCALKNLPLRSIPPTALRWWAPPVHEATGGPGFYRAHPLRTGGAYAKKASGAYQGPFLWFRWAKTGCFAHDGWGLVAEFPYGLAVLGGLVVLSVQLEYHKVRIVL